MLFTHMKQKDVTLLIVVITFMPPDVRDGI